MRATGTRGPSVRHPPSSSASPPDLLELRSRGLPRLAHVEVRAPDLEELVPGAALELDQVRGEPLGEIERREPQKLEVWVADLGELARDVELELVAARAWPLGGVARLEPRVREARVADLEGLVRDDVSSVSRNASSVSVSASNFTERSSDTTPECVRCGSPTSRNSSVPLDSSTSRSASSAASSVRLSETWGARPQSASVHLPPSTLVTRAVTSRLWNSNGSKAPLVRGPGRRPRVVRTSETSSVADAPSTRGRAELKRPESAKLPSSELVPACAVIAGL